MTRERDRIQENANKYIVKNCPFAYGFINEPMYCLWKDEAPTANTLCQDCTDCIIKQVIEKCKEETVINCPKREKEFITVNGYQVILNMFDIVEINK